VSFLTVGSGKTVQVKLVRLLMLCLCTKFPLAIASRLKAEEKFRTAAILLFFILQKAAQQILNIFQDLPLYVISGPCSKWHYCRSDPTNLRDSHIISDYGK
jgi:hypothetical protein